MSINPSTAAHAVATTAVAVITDTTTPTGRNEDGRCTYEIYNAGPDACFIGGSNVTAANGQPLPANAARTMAVRFGAQVYAICDTGDTADVRVLRVP